MAQITLNSSGVASSGSLVLQSNGTTTAVTIDTSQRAVFVAGTAALPAITTTGDTNTGIFFPAADTIAFSEGGAEAARLDSSGNLGVGTTSPSQRIHASKAGDTYIQVSRTVSSTEANLLLGCESSSNVIYSRDATTGNAPLLFFTGTTERVRIDSSGNFLVGTTSRSDSETISVSISAANGLGILYRPQTNASYYAEIFRNSSNASVGNIFCTASATTYATSSDYRLKKDITPMTGALATVAALKPITYKWKVDGSESQGFIAHELQAVIPDAVVGEKDAVDANGNPQYQGVDTSFLVATLTAAIQEQQVIIEQLKARLDAANL